MYQTSSTLVCFCILHYKNIQVTINCVNDILKNNYLQRESALKQNFCVLVIDNGSNNETGAQLEKYYEDNALVVIIKNKVNLGFAKGNNIAYHYAKNNIGADVIVVMNSDMLTEGHFTAEAIRLSCKKNRDNDVGIIAPDILNKKGLHQNPFRVKPLSKSAYVTSIIKNLLVVAAINFPILGEFFYLKYQRHINEKTKKKQKRIDEFDNFDFVPHGSCIIFTPKWVHNEEIAFLPITFLYCEEEILYTYAKRKGYKILYDDTLQIKHLEDASLNAAYEDGKKKISFQYIEQSKSIIRYLRYRCRGIHEIK